LQRRARPVGPDNLSFVANEPCTQEGDVANTAPDVEHAHTGSDPDLDEKTPPDWSTRRA
jgi:hypothetical protein